MRVADAKVHELAPSILDNTSVVSIGIIEFAESLRAQNVDVIHVQWSPPAISNEELLNLLDALL